MKRHLLTFLLLPALAIAAAGDDKFIAAHEAFRVAEPVRLARAAAEFKTDNPASELGSGLTGEGGTGSSSGKKGSGAGNKTKAEFFGVEGNGSTFAYVMDRSDSMNSLGGAPLRRAKQELLKSIESLNEYNQFQIVFYNDSLSPMASGLIFATDREKRRAASFVRLMPGDGGTAHFPALRKALSMSPEVLFFLTDADDPILTLAQLTEIQRRTEISKTTIHAIQFNGGPPMNDGSWIRKLAEMNRGKYKYVDVTSINTPPNE